MTILLFLFLSLFSFWNSSITKKKRIQYIIIERVFCNLYMYTIPFIFLEFEEEKNRYSKFNSFRMMIMLRIILLL